MTTDDRTCSSPAAPDSSARTSSMRCSNAPRRRGSRSWTALDGRQSRGTSSPRRRPAVLVRRSATSSDARARATSWWRAPTRVIHAAAETHVDRSIDDPRAFLRTNVLGTQAVLEACRNRGRAHADGLDGRGLRTGRVGDGRLRRGPRPRPAIPYAASKAAADLLCSAYVTTYGTRRDDRARDERLRAAPDRARGADVTRSARWRAGRCRCTATGGNGASSCS